MRAFLSIHLSEIVQTRVEQLQSQLAAELPGVRWTRPANCHLTLKFFGDIDSSIENAIAARLPALVEQFSPFTVEFKGVGQFPPRGPLSVLWVGVDCGAAALVALENAVREALDVASIKFDAKPFKPHLTIGRAPHGRKIYLRSQQKYAAWSVGTMNIDGISLMQSVLDPHGAIYTERQRFAFAPQ